MGISLVLKLVFGILEPFLNLIQMVMGIVSDFSNQLTGKLLDGIKYVTDKIQGFFNFLSDKLSGLIDGLLRFLGLSKKASEVDLEGVGVTDTITTANGSTTYQNGETTNFEDITTKVNDNLKNFNQTNYNYNNDSSTKNQVINVVVENYAEHLDVDEFIKKINIKLAEAM
jgi:hypothetical protein